MGGLPTYVVVIAAFFLMSLMGVGVAYVWDPDSVGEEFAIKIAASFGILLAGSILMSIIGKSMKPRDGKEQDKT